VPYGFVPWKACKSASLNFQIRKNDTLKNQHLRKWLISSGLSVHGMYALLTIVNILTINHLTLFDMPFFARFSHSHEHFAAGH
jgi:hypothetical protein